MDAFQEGDAVDFDIVAGWDYFEFDEVVFTLEDGTVLPHNTKLTEIDGIITFVFMMKANNNNTKQINKYINA